MRVRDGEENTRAILTMDGVGCASCAYTIEHVGRKQHGVRDIRVHIGRGEIEVMYNGNRHVLVAIQNIIRRIGHNAEIKDGRTGCGKSDCCGEHLHE
ncbi:MAG: hypothetical protein ISS35_01365 [Kiritimatiellae bacterium]|nr:hypothetical protein [Kiritimatiellia bacterium]